MELRTDRLVFHEGGFPLRGVLVQPVLLRRHWALAGAAFLIQIAVSRGDHETRERCRLRAEGRGESSHMDLASTATLRELERGAHSRALALARPVLDATGAAMENVEEAFAVCVEAVLALADAPALADLESFVGGLLLARTTPLLKAGRARLAAEQAHRRGDEDESERLEGEAIELLRSVGARPLLAKTLLARAARRADADALAEGRSIYAELGATASLERIEQRSEVAV